jgi:hypothetical protein
MTTKDSNVNLILNNINNFDTNNQDKLRGYRIMDASDTSAKALELNVSVANKHVDALFIFQNIKLPKDSHITLKFTEVTGTAEKPVGALIKDTYTPEYLTKVSTILKDEKYTDANTLILQMKDTNITKNTNMKISIDDYVDKIINNPINLLVIAFNNCTYSDDIKDVTFNLMKLPCDTCPICPVCPTCPACIIPEYQFNTLAIILSSVIGLLIIFLIIMMSL